MRVLIFGHLDNQGGAQNALRKLVKLLTEYGHDIFISLPSDTGSESAFYRAQGINCFKLELGLVLPDFSRGLLAYSFQNFQKISDDFKVFDFDLVITNTVTILHGALIANQLEIPHIYYAHESLSDIELQPSGIAIETYIKTLTSSSDAIISCSNYVESQFHELPMELKLVLSPYDFNQEVTIQKFNPESPLAIQIIGVQSERKNANFCTILSKALDLRGIEVVFHIIGNPGNDTQNIIRNVNRRELSNIIFHPQCEDPYLLNQGERVITLVSSRMEPYGLTIPESLQRGIPVLATKSGGPEELLAPEDLFDFDDLDTCARRIIQIANNYKSSSESALQRFKELKSKEFNCIASINNLNTLITNVKKNKLRSKVNLFTSELISKLSTLYSSSIDTLEIAKNISRISQKSSNPMTSNNVIAAIKNERENPGLAVLEDIKRFDVIPFAYSQEIDDLYKNGLGLAIELAATAGDTARILMSSFILTCLTELKHHKSEIKILALGDGLATDAIRFANCGFSVDYIDYDNSLMAKVAALNCESFFGDGQKKVNFINKIESKYDAVICLEVIEHVPEPFKFLENLNDYLADEGLLFISECFSGIENRWPTHIYKNENLSLQILNIKNQRFELISSNINPYGKPYVFKKNNLHAF